MKYAASGKVSWEVRGGQKCWGRSYPTPNSFAGGLLIPRRPGVAIWSCGHPRPRVPLPRPGCAGCGHGTEKPPSWLASCAVLGGAPGSSGPRRRRGAWVGQGAGEPGGSVVPGRWQTSSCLCAGRAEAGWNSSQPASLAREETPVPPLDLCPWLSGTSETPSVPRSLRGHLVLAAGPEP